MKRNILKFSSCLLFFVSFSSCRKVIHVDLNSTNPKIVVEASISDEPGPYTVSLYKTVNFDQSNSFPAVSGAVVKISDDAGNFELLTETSSGIYATSSLQGVPGRVYTLEISADGKTYTSVSGMPLPAAIDTLLIQNYPFGNIKLVNVYFQDSTGISNYYQFGLEVNTIPSKSIFIIDDTFQDGTKMEYSLFGQRDSLLKTGDSVLVSLRSIDKGAYEYLRTLSLLTGDGGGPPSDSPANPVSNISNGALGYFSAYSVRKKLIVVQ